MSTAREVLKNKQTKNKTNKKTQTVPSQGWDRRAPTAGQAPSSFSSLFSSTFFLIQSFGHELRTGVVNKQVMGREGREGLGQGRTNSHCPQDRFLEGSVQEKGHTGGSLSSGGSLEPHCLRKIFTCIHHAGAGCTELPGGHLGDTGAISP